MSSVARMIDSRLLRDRATRRLKFEPSMVIEARSADEVGLVVGLRSILRSTPRSRMSSSGKMKILVPVSGDEADLLDFALEECRSRQAALIVLFLRPIGVMPMGPNPMPGLAEDEQANATFNRLVDESGRMGISLRTIYITTSDIPATIGEIARVVEADVVMVGTTRRAGFSRFLSRDLTPSILKMLPEHASLTIRAS